MTLLRALAVVTVWAALSALAQPASACSCMRPQAKLWAPLDTAPAARNTHITVALPAALASHLVVRPVGGAPVAVTQQRYPSGALLVVVLTPKAPLAQSTRYEIAIVNQPKHPRTLVFGTFATGDFTDDAAPVFGRVTSVRYHDEMTAAGTSCQSHQRWAEVTAAPAHDMDRPKATIHYGVWLPDQRGRIDVRAPPTWLLPMSDGVITVGAKFMCAWLRPQLPTKAATLPIAVAAFDEAGNRSKVQRSTLTITRPRQP